MWNVITDGHGTKFQSSLLWAGNALYCVLQKFQFIQIYCLKNDSNRHVYYRKKFCWATSIFKIDWYNWRYMIFLNFDARNVTRSESGKGELVFVGINKYNKWWWGVKQRVGVLYHHTNIIIVIYPLSFH